MVLDVVVRERVLRRRKGSYGLYVAHESMFDRPACLLALCAAVGKRRDYACCK